MKGLGLASAAALLSVLLILSFSVSVSAADIYDDQEDISLVIEQGGSAEFILTVFNTESNDILFPDGDIEDWISFGESHLALYECENRGIDWVKITIDVPADTAVGEYEGLILSNGDYSDITVKVVPRLDEIKSMQDLEEMKEELQAMTDSISQELNSTKGDLQGKIAEISQYQQNLEETEAELAELREKSQDLEEANTQLTGQVAGGAPAQIAVGIVIGIIIVILYLGRRGIARALRSARRPSAGGAEGGEKYRGWKP
jgi:ElaB/YqjD/DUF883 family membrane-anchored ribosome-binding protein